MELYDLKTIRPLLERHGFHFSKALGQNFLIQEWVPRRILEVSGVDEHSGVLEVGPGIGVLTQALCCRAGHVVAVELDKALLPLLDETLAEYPNKTVVSADIMKTDIPALVREKLPGLRPLACANLPYNITTPVLKALLEAGCFSQITVMVQKEVAERICAAPGTAAYGAFSLFVRYYTEPSICFEVPPNCFYPQPKVTSAVLTLKQVPPPAALRSKDMLFSLTRAAFAQRRKTLVNGLSPLFAGRLTKEELTGVLTACGHDPRVRGETLGLSEFVELANAFTARLG